MSENPSLAQIKHLNRLDQVLARSEWSNADVDEGVMLGQDGRVLCGTMSNLLIQRGDSLITPSLESAGIAGVVRGLLLQLGERQRTNVREERVSLEQLVRSDAVYVTNSLIGVVRVGRFETTRYDMDIAEHPLVGEARSRCHASGGDS
jgi:4-amino-4-deoxychorismate lyase